MSTNIFENINLPVLRETVKPSNSREYTIGELRKFYKENKIIPDEFYYPQGQYHLHPKKNNISGQSFVQAQRVYNGFDE